MRLSSSFYYRVAVGRLLSFFFSSRRRHTRCYRDWSSDVCSSDLVMIAMAIMTSLSPKLTLDLLPFIPITGLFTWRSEERRVGKECRFLRGPGHLNRQFVKFFMVIAILTTPIP